MVSLDWSQCPAVESLPVKLEGAWLFKGTWMPVKVVFENLEAGMTVNEITGIFGVTREEVKTVLRFVSESLAGAWRFKGTRMPVKVVFENLGAGMSVDEIAGMFDVTREEVKSVLHFASESLTNEPASGYSQYEVLNRISRKAAMVILFANLSVLLCIYLGYNGVAAVLGLLTGFSTLFVVFRQAPSHGVNQIEQLNNKNLPNIRVPREGGR